MNRHPWFVRIATFLIGGLVLAGVMGGGCDGLTPVFPDVPGILDDDVITIELVNTTPNLVDPFLYVDPNEDVFFNNLIIDGNLVLLDPPELAPGEVVTLVFDCQDVGSVVSDRAELITDLEIIESDNSPLLIEADDFVCGDLISFIYIDDPGEEVFFTRVEVNDVFLTDTD